MHPLSSGRARAELRDFVVLGRSTSTVPAAVKTGFS